MNRIAFGLVVLAVAASAIDEEKTFTHGGVKSEHGPATWVAMIGDVCQLSNVPRPFPNNTRMYIECVRHREFEQTNDNLGIWTINECLAGQMFSPLDSHCAPSRRVRRAQQNLCQSNPQACGPAQFQVAQQQPQQQPCPCQPPAPPTASCVCSAPPIMQPVPAPAQPACPCQQQPSCPCAPAAPVVVQPMPCPQAQGTGGQGAVENGICSWMLDPLAAHPSKRNCFLQCQPAPYNVFCGRWRTMPCSIYTVFDVQLQVCVNDPAAPVGQLPPAQPQQPIFAPQPPQQPAQSCGCTVGVNIGTCGSNYQCPGMSQCQVTQPAQQQQSCSTCCYFGAIFRK